MKKQSKSVQHLFGVAFTVLFVLTGFISGSSGNGSLVNAQESGSSGTTTPSTIATPAVLAIDPTNPATLYAGTRFYGVFKSTDSGASWQQLGGLRLFDISTLTIDPVNPNTIYAGTYPNLSCGLYVNPLLKSTNGGSSWQRLNTGELLSACQTIYSVAVAPSNPNVLYVINSAFNGSCSLLRSDDGGNNFVGLGCNAGYRVIAVAPDDPYTIYVGTSFNGPVDARGLLKSTDGGLSAATAGLSAISISALTIDPFRRGTIYAAATTYSFDEDEAYEGLFKRVEGSPSPDSAKWFAINSGLGQLIYTQSIIRSLIIDPNNSNILYVGTNGSGVFRSTDGGANWIPFNVGLPTLFVSSLVITNDNPAIPYAIASGGIFKFINNRWVRLPDLLVPPPPIPGISSSPKGN